MAKKSQGSLQNYIYLSIAAAIVTILLKFYTYYITGSMGFLSDALESFVNLFAAIFALIMLKLSQQPADERHMYGHSKAEYFSSRSEEHTSELQSRPHLVCRLLLEKKNI